MNPALLLEVRDLKRHYQIGGGLLRQAKTLKAVDGVSFTLAAGKTLAVVGESGCGKSTLARMVTMIETPTAGSLKIDGVEVTTADGAALKRLRPVVQMVFQNPYGSLNPRKKVGTILEEPVVINAHISPEARHAAARDMLAKVGLRPEHYARYPHMFSGGQRQRIAIARALMLNPRIVVADEPVSALDVSIRAQVLLAATPSVDPTARSKRMTVKGELPSPINPPSGCAFHRRCPFATDKCAAERPELRAVAGRLVACHYAETTI